MIEPIDLNQFEETRYLEPSPCADELAQLRQLVEGLRNEIELDWSPQVDKLSMQVIQLEAQAATIAAERDELQKQLKDTRDELSVYRLASETAMYEAGEFDAGLFLSGDRGVEDVMRRVLRELEIARMKASQAAEGYELERQARILAVQQRDQLRLERDDLRRACAEFKQLAESEVGQ